MSNYRTVQQISSQNFGGINSNATVLNIGDNQAASIVNWDISSRGSIKKRGGIVSSELNPGNGEILALAKFLNSSYAEKYAAIASSASVSGYTIWEASSPTGTWTERYGSKTLASAGAPIMAGWIGKLFIANGVNQPLVLDPGTNADTMENASLVVSPATCSAVVALGGGLGDGSTMFYAVTSVTPRGESPIRSTSGVGSTTLWFLANLTATHTNTVSWIPVDGCSSQRIYYGTTAIAPQLVAEVSPNTSSFTHDAPGYLNIGGVTWYPPGVNTAYNTPNDWNTNGPPKGFAIVAKGTDERMFAWRGNTVWASALRNPLNWFAQNDAFAFTLVGGEDNAVTGIASLYDYLLIFTRTNCFVFLGSSSTSITLQKIIPVGCLSHLSICYARGDVWFWSNYGPTSFSRVQAGQDIATATSLADRIRPIVYDQTNTSLWTDICAHVDVPKSRIVWSLAGVGATVHSMAVVYQYDCDGFTTYNNWAIGYPVVNNDFSINAVRNKVAIATLNSTNADDGAAINAVYSSGHFDMRSWEPRKRVTYTDVVVNRGLGAYSVTLAHSFDYGYYTSSAITMTETSTDSATIGTTSASTTEHRIYTDGMGNAFQLIFTANNTSPCEVVGWRPSVVFKGVRV